MSSRVLVQSLLHQPSLTVAVKEGVCNGVDRCGIPASPVQAEANGAVREAALEFHATEPLFAAGEDNVAVLKERRRGVLVEGTNSENPHDVTPLGGAPLR